MNKAKRPLIAVLKAVLISVLVFFLITVLNVVDGDDADLRYRSLDYDVTVQADGSLDITQHIDMRLRERSDDDGDRPWKQLYQQYKLTQGNLSDITNISVTNVTTGETYTQQNTPRTPDGIDDAAWNSEYAGHWYIADVTGGADDPRPYVPGKDGLAFRDDGSVSGETEKTVEIGWNIPVTDEADSLKFDVTMTFVGATTAYADVAAFQWEPFGESNQVPIGTVSGIVRFPGGITESNSWAWLHYEGTSETSRGTDGSLRFTAHDVRSGDYLDVVAAFDSSVLRGPNGERITPDPEHTYEVPAVGGVTYLHSGDWIRDNSNGIYLPALKRSETRQEQQWRDRQRTQARIRLVLWIVAGVAGVAFAVAAVALAIRSRRSARYRGDIEYWREPPDMSPASAANMADVLELVPHVSRKRNELGNRQMTATILSLASKHAIAIYPGAAGQYRGIDMSRPDRVRLAARFDGVGGGIAGGSVADPNTSTVVIMPVSYDARESLRLSQSEDAALELLIEIAKRAGGPVFDLTGMNRACKDWEDGYKSLERFTKACTNEFALLGATKTTGVGVGLCGGVGLVAALAGMISFSLNGMFVLSWAIWLPIAAANLFAACYACYTKVTDAGQYYAGQVQGLYRYLEDFSDFSDRGAADLVLWDRYLVYAAAFGISDKALAELAKAYPEISDPRWLDDNASNSMLYWTYRPYWRHWRGRADGNSGGPFPSGSGFVPGVNFGDFGAQINAEFAQIRSTIQAAAPSSGGSGGSFSGGGFGGSAGGSGGGSFGGR